MLKSGVSKLVILGIFLICQRGFCQTFYVDANSPNNPGTGSYADPYRKIQNAVNNAQNTDVIILNPGIYSGADNKDIDTGGKSIIIRSTNPSDPDIVAATIINPNGLGRGFYFHSGEDANCVIDGISIINAKSSGGSGGAVYCQSSSPTLIRCVITGCTADLYGGAIFLEFSDSLVRQCTLGGNSSLSDGGAIECWGGTPTLQNCLIIKNQTTGNGGGIDCYLSADINLKNCTLLANSANDGGAIYCLGSKISADNCIFRADSAAHGTEISVPNLYGTKGTASVAYTDMDGGMASVYVGTGSTLIWGDGNIDSDPCFVAFNPAANWQSWDLHLQSSDGRWDPAAKIWVTDANTSPCIDAANPVADYGLELWPNGKRLNMGAYGGTAQASKSGNIADFNIDGWVNNEDYADFADKWLLTGSYIEDLTGDGTVNYEDLAIFVENWLWNG